MGPYEFRSVKVHEVQQKCLCNVLGKENSVPVRVGETWYLGEIGDFVIISKYIYVSRE